MKLLIYLTENEEEMYEREISRGAKVSMGSANSILNKFAKKGYIIKTVKGRMSFYKLNPTNPSMRQFRIFIEVNSLENFLKKASIFSSKIILYGSSALGSNAKGSPIEILIITEEIEKEKIRKICEEFPFIKPLLLSNEEFASLKERDALLFDKISKGIVLKGE